MQYCSLQHRTLLLSTSHIHSWVFFLLWLHPFILSGDISPGNLYSSLCFFQPSVSHDVLCKLEVVKQEMARVNIDILGISELKWTGMGKFNSDDHYIYYCGQESLRRNGVAIMVNKRVQNAGLGCNLKNDRMIPSFPR